MTPISRTWNPGDFALAQSHVFKLVEKNDQDHMPCYRLRVLCTGVRTWAQEGHHRGDSDRYEEAKLLKG
jgi:hypothetical protein